MANEPHAQKQQSGTEGTPEFSEFPVTSYAEWREAAEATLRGAPFEKRLITRTYENIDLQPLYRQDDTAGVSHLGSLPGFAPYVRGTSTLGYAARPWDVAQEISCATSEEFNKALLSDMERGQNSVNLMLDRATLAGVDADNAPAEEVGKGGVSISSIEDLAKALEGVDLERTSIYLQASTSALAFTALLIALVRRKGLAIDRLRGCVGMDPLGILAAYGILPRPAEEIYDVMARLTAWASAHTPNLQTITVQGHPYHDSGASATQELAFALATGVEYLREMQARGVDADAAAARMRFSFSLGSNMFMEIARLRAARLLWAKIVNAFGGAAEAQKMHLHGRTSRWNKTVYDPYVNMLRTTTEAFSGVAGGVDSLHVSPFDEVIRAPDEFSRRIARNTHTILREECHIPRTIDPAGGSWYVEKLTDEIAANSWQIFQEVEKRGGMLKALEAGFPQAEAETIARKRAANAAVRKDIFVGTNRYPNMQEQPLSAEAIDHSGLQRTRSAQLAQYRNSVDVDWCNSQLEKMARDRDRSVEAAIQAASAGATIGEIAAALRTGAGAGPSVKPLHIHRGAEAFEALRQATAGYKACTGAAPKVFLANMGPIPQHKARADFSRGFLEVGAFDILGNDGFASVEEAAQAAIESGAPVVVICSSDKTYPDLVPPLTQQIKAAKPDTTVLLAGYPAEHVDAFRAAGVDDFIHIRANCYEILQNLQQKIGVV